MLSSYILKLHLYYIAEINMNKKQAQTKQPLAHWRNKWRAKNLSNIEEDFELESEIRMPSIHKVQNKVSHVSEKQLDIKLKRIINIGSSRTSKKHSVQSHSSFLTNAKLPLSAQNLPQLKPLRQPKRNKSSLDKILSDQNVFAKAYFEDIQRTDKNRKMHPEDNDIEFQFPEIIVGPWTVRGYLKQNHIFMKGTHKDGRVCIKKYAYDKVYPKLRKDYQTWVNSKFSFEA